MPTLAYVLILIGIVIVRAVTRGRSITEIPDDMGDLFINAVSMDYDGIKEVLSRKTEDAPRTAPAADGDANRKVGGDAHTQGELIALGHDLKARGYLVAQGPPPFGPIGTRRSKTSYHFKSGPTGIPGLALDINWSPASQEPAKLDQLAKELRAKGWDFKWREAGHYDHLHVDTQSPR